MKMFKRSMAVLLAICLCLTSAQVASAAEKTVTVKNQKELNKAVKEGKATTIKIKTSKDVKLTIPAGSTTEKIKLVVNAPKATIVNKGNYKSITLGGSAVKHYTENGNYNTIKVTAPTARVVISKKTTVKKLTVQSEKANVQVNKGSHVAQVVAAKADGTLNLRVNGSAESVKAASEGVKLNLKGETKSIPVVVAAKNVKIAATVAVEANLQETAKIVLKNGAEGSDIKVEEGVDAIVENNSTEEVKVTTPTGEVKVDSNETADTVINTDPTPSTTPDSGSSSGGGSSNSGGGGSVRVDVTGVTLDKDRADLKVGQTLQLNASVVPSNATNKRLVWTATGGAVTVSSTGLVTAEREGTGVVTVATEEGGLKKTCTITVTPADQEPAKSSEKQITSFKIGDKVGTIDESAKTISVTVAHDANVTQLTPTIEISAKATVNPASGVQQDFTSPVTYTVTAEDKTTAEYTVTVTKEQTPGPDATSVTGIKLDKSTANVATGGSITLTATIEPGDATNKEVTWTVSGSAVTLNGTPTVSGAAVTATFKAGNTAGEAVVTVTTEDGNFTAACTITVTDGVVRVTYSPKQMPESVYEVYGLKAVEPVKAFTFSSILTLNHLGRQ